MMVTVQFFIIVNSPSGKDQFNTLDTVQNCGFSQLQHELHECMSGNAMIKLLASLKLKDRHVKDKPKFSSERSFCVLLSFQSGLKPALHAGTFETWISVRHAAVDISYMTRGDIQILKCTAACRPASHTEEHSLGRGNYA
jgi:hypothetical protein